MSLKIFAAILVLILTFLTGFCQGMNRGWEAALQNDNACQPHPQQCNLN